MNKFNRKHFNKVIADYLSRPVTMSAIWGFVIGAILPTYALIIKRKTLGLGDAGTWVGAIATFMAVRVSLYLANRKDIPDLRWFDETQGWDPLNQNIELVNYGRGSTEVKVSASVSEKIFDSLPGDDEPKNMADWLITKAKIDIELLKIIKHNGNVIKTTDRIKIASQGRLVLSLDASQALKDAIKNMFELLGKDEANVFLVTIMVEDLNHNVLRKGVIIPYRF